MIKKAMVLAAGFGKRVQPLTLDCPKPLLKIGNETLLSNTFKFLKLAGINHVVINTHYLSNHIEDYIEKNNFNLNIKIVLEKNKILDTGGGVLNAIDNFSNESFLIINPDTIWSDKYLKELQLMKKLFFENTKTYCSILLVNKQKSFDKNFKGDFNLKNNVVSRHVDDKLDYVYTGLQIINPKAFLDFNSEVFSINDVWNKLIKNNQLIGFESNANFLHVSTLKIYKSLVENYFKH
jgi:MurNAc alpha-1-phosphate uridylyltransferase